MIAQLMAMNWQHRFLSLCSIMSDTGNSKRQRASLHTLAYLFLYRPFYAPPKDSSTQEELAAYEAVSTSYTIR